MLSNTFSEIKKEVMSAMVRLSVTVLVLASVAQAAPGGTPVSGSQLEVFSGDSLTLYCPLYVTNNSVILWSKEDRIMFAGSLRVRMDDRFHVVNDNLIISSVRPEDAGTISCQVEDEARRLEVFSYSVEVLEAAAASITVGDHLTVKAGTSLSLSCVGSGVPVPEVRWRRGSRLLSRGLGEAGVLLEYVTREDAGDLVCEASNGVGEMAQDTLNLDVLHKPEVEMLEPHLSFQPRCGLELQCVVHSSSTPVVQWRQGDLLLHPGPGVTIWSLDNLHVLQLASCDPGILGTFSCRADNNLGQAEASVELSSKWLEESLDTFHRQEEQFNNVRRNVAAEEQQQQSLPLTSSSSRLSCLSISSFLVMLSISLFSMF